MSKIDDDIKQLICEAFRNENHDLYIQMENLSRSVLLMAEGDGIPLEFIKDSVVNDLRELIKSNSDKTHNNRIEFGSCAGADNPAIPQAVPMIRSISQEEAIKIAEEAEKFEEEAKRFFFCGICQTSELVSGSYELQCGHRFCAESLRQYVHFKVDSNAVSDDDLRCPNGGGCEHVLDMIIIEEILSKEQWIKYEERRTERIIEIGLAKSTMMRCPKEPCNIIFELVNPQSIRGMHWLCPCGGDFCINCQVNETGQVLSFAPGHGNRTCVQERERLAADAAAKEMFDRWQADNAAAQARFEELMRNEHNRACPICHVMISRNGGCDHMTCSRCKCNFCYICGKYNPDNPTSRGDCGVSHKGPAVDWVPPRK